MHAGELDFAARLRKLRKDRRLTQGQVAERAGVSRNYVHRLEVGARKLPTREVIVGLAHALDVTTDELIGSFPLGPAPDPWSVALAERLDALPEELGARLRQLIEDFVAVVEQPLAAYYTAAQALTAETAELSAAELQQVAEFALQLLAEPGAAGAAAPAADGGRASAG
jgi:transcriptional regulator with XRE-family HTH domain